eukprot:scaffold1934_cov27-Tisochrysis_lutea.AAC.2
MLACGHPHEGLQASIHSSSILCPTLPHSSFLSAGHLTKTAGRPRGLTPSPLPEASAAPAPYPVPPGVAPCPVAPCCAPARQQPSA